jgi:hypothetical protein
MKENLNEDAENLQHIAKEWGARLPIEKQHNAEYN